MHTYYKTPKALEFMGNGVLRSSQWFPHFPGSWVTDIAEI